jgi:DNA-binding GntR family transcriptional regulator
MAATARRHEVAFGDGAPSSLADRAYLQLREEIISTELPPGTLLREDELMGRLGMGRTPVREAIQRLQRDGFVTVIPRRGTLVSEVNIMDLAAIYEVRKRLEAWASRLAAERARESDRQDAQRLIEELERLAPDSEHEALLALDRRIHRFVYGCSKNPFLAETLDHYHNLSLRILHVAMTRYPVLTPRLEDVVQEQRTLLKAICSGDGDTAERVAREHVASFEQEIRQVI